MVSASAARSAYDGSIIDDGYVHAPNTINTADLFNA